MSASYPKRPDLQAFEDWARTKTWFLKTRGHFDRNSNDTAYTHYRVNDRANAFLAGITYTQFVVDHKLHELAAWRAEAELCASEGAHPLAQQTIALLRARVTLRLATGSDAAQLSHPEA